MASGGTDEAVRMVTVRSDGQEGLAAKGSTGGIVREAISGEQKFKGPSNRPG